MNEIKAKAVIMGQDILAGIDDETLSIITLGIVLSFETREDLKDALYSDRPVQISVFEEPT